MSVHWGCSFVFHKHCGNTLGLKVKVKMWILRSRRIPVLRGRPTHCTGKFQYSGAVQLKWIALPPQCRAYFGCFLFDSCSRHSPLSIFNRIARSGWSSHKATLSSSLEIPPAKGVRNSKSCCRRGAVCILRYVLPSRHSPLCVHLLKSCSRRNFRCHSCLRLREFCTCRHNPEASLFYF